MGMRGELHSEKLSVADGKRIYFFNVKENRHGDKFIVIAENVFKFDDRVNRQQIVIYQEHLDDFRYALNKAVSALGSKTGHASHVKRSQDFARPAKKNDGHKRYRTQPTASKVTHDKGKNPQQS